MKKQTCLKISAEHELTNSSSINVIMGKNGCGKSILLRIFDSKPELDTTYISPERGGNIEYNSELENKVAHPLYDESSERRKNQSVAFRSASTIKLYNFLHSFLKRTGVQYIGSYPEIDRFLQKINLLLDNIYIEFNPEIEPKDGSTEFFSFNPQITIKSKKTKDPIQPNEISSGESEIISLATEVLYFSKSHQQESYLLMDEPDVHLHPDLQQRFMQFLVDIVEENSSIKIFIATHSTPILSSLTDFKDARVAFMKKGDTKLDFMPIDNTLSSVLPIFGAHPLSSVFNQSPILLVEGDDEIIIWQQVIRSSKGKIKIYPCSVDGVNKLHKHEKQTNIIISSVYDNPIAFSLRDGDKDPGVKLDNVGLVKRFRLNCYSSENLLLTDDVLEKCNLTWDDVKEKIKEWERNNAKHSRYNCIKEFIDGGFQRREAKIKKIINILASMRASKAWQILLGRAIADLSEDSPVGEGSLRSFLGEEFVQEIIFRKNTKTN